MPHPLFGRADDLAVLADAWGAACGGDPTVVVLSGGAGAGKTELVRAFATQVDAVVLVAPVTTTVRDEQACWGVLTALRDHVERSGPDLGGTMWSEELDALLTANPGPASPRRTALGALGIVRRALGDLAASSPVLLVVDDVHRADPTTLDLVRHVVSGLDGLRLLVVATYRTEEVGPGHPLRATLTDLHTDRRVRLHEVRPLSRADVADLVDGAVGDAPELVDAAWTWSGGNPYIVDEVLRGAGDGAPAIRAVTQRLVLAGLDRLSQNALQVVRALSLSSTAVDHEVLAEVVDVGEPELSDFVSEAMAAGPVVVDGTRRGFGLRDGLLREVVAEDLLPATRRSLHRRYGAALEGHRALGGPGTAAEAARHWCLADDPGRAVPALGAAVEEAERAAEFAEAHRHGLRALELLDERAAGPPEDRADLAERTAANAHLAGAHDTAIRLMRGLVPDGARPEAARTSAARRTAELARYLLAAGRTSEAAATARGAVELAPGDDDPGRASALAVHAEALLAVGEHHAALDGAERTLTLASRSEARPERARALAALGAARTLLGDADGGLAALHEGLDTAEQAHAPQEIGSVYVDLAGLLVGSLDEVDDGVRIARRGADRVAQLGLGSTAGARLCAVLAEGLHHLGRWDEAARAVEHGFAADPHPADAVGLRLARCRLRLGRGEVETAELDLDELDHGLVRSPEARTAVQVLRADVATARGRPGEVRRLVLRGLAWAAPGDARTLAPLLWRGLRTEAELSAAPVPTPRVPVDEQHPLRVLIGQVERLRRSAEQPGSPVRPVPAAWLELCRAEELRAVGRSDGSSWEACAATWDAAGHPFLAAYCRLRLGEALLAERSRSSAASEALCRAHRQAVALGARPLVEEIEELTGRARITVPISPPDEVSSAAPPPPETRTMDVSMLTARERNVLVELARGLTNREIGERLYISEKTVSVHVTHILAKLGVRTRVEASAVLHRTPRSTAQG